MKFRQLLYSLPLLALASCDQLGPVDDIKPEYSVTSIGHYAF